MDMKKYLLLLLLFPFTAFGQKTDSVAFKGARMIVINSNKSQIEGLKLTVKALSDIGFNVEHAVPELGTLRTQQKSISLHGLQIIDVLSSDSVITLSTRIRSSELDGTESGEGRHKVFGTVYYSGKRLDRIAFEHLHKVAKSLGFSFVYSN